MALLFVLKKRVYNREIITGFCADWNKRYPSSLSRNKLAEQYKSFLKFCGVAGWLVDIPQWPKGEHGFAALFGLRS